MPSPATFVFSLRIILITMGVLSIAMALKFSVPIFIGFCLNDVPVLMNSLKVWLKPPYLYFVINGIIMTIAASSWFSHQKHQLDIPAQTGQSQVQLITMRTPPPSEVVAALVLAEAPVEEAEQEVVMYEAEAEEGDESEGEVEELKKAVVVNGIEQLETVESGVGDDGDVANDERWIVPKSDFTPSQQIESREESQLDFVLPVKEKALAFSRFRHLSDEAGLSKYSPASLPSRPMTRAASPNSILAHLWLTMVS